MTFRRIIWLIVAVVTATSMLTIPLVAQQGTTTTPTANVSTRTALVDGMAVGEVMVGDRVVLRIREPAGGYSVGQRAEIVASRLQAQLNMGRSWSDVRVGMQNSEVVLLMGSALLITVDQAHARLNGTTPLRLAYDWQGNVQTALRQGGPVVGGSEENFPDWTRAENRIVPILAVGTPGVRLGFAQVTGPADRVNQVTAVLQLDAVFQRAARIYAFIPSRQATSVQRVQGVAVTALLEYGVFRF